ncbi:MAG: hypothetical protein IPH62_04365 [Ignavibacteriae bacterium]|nr:hypothetical protein [Ignavibacteriota bacterium]
MLEKEIQNLISINTNKIKELGEKFQLFELHNVKIHPALIKYILSAVDYQFQIEKQFIQKNSKFDYTGEKIEKLFSLISKEFKKEKEFSSIFINDLIKEAVKFNANFLAKPNQTLINFIFDEKREISNDEIIYKLKFAYYYKYIVKLTQSFLSKKKNKTITRKEFAFLLSKIDQITKKNHLQNIINTSLNSMVNFFDQANSQQNEFPYEAIQMFFEEKELDNFSQRLQLQFEFEKPKNLQINEVQKLFVSDFDGIEISTENNFELLENNIDLVENNFSNVAENKEEILIPVNINSEIIEEENKIIIEETKTVENENKFFEIEKSELENIEILKPEIETTEVENLKSKIQTEEIKIEPETEIENNSVTNNLVEEKTEIENLEVDNTKITKPETGNLESEIKTEESLNINTELLNGKPDVKKIVRNLIDIDSIYDSLIPQPTAFENINLLKDINLAELVQSSDFQFDVTNISENLLVEVPTDEQYIGIVEDKTFEDSNEINEELDSIMLDSDIDIEIETNSFTKMKSENENLISEDVDFNSTIDDIVQNEKYEKEFLQNNSKSNIDDLDNDETQEMNNLIDDEKLKLNDDEVTEVFTDMTYLGKDEIEEQKIIQENQPETRNKIENESQDYQENFNDSQTGVKVIYSSFQELVSTKEMTNIIETMFDYDMEDYYGIVRKISNAFDEKEALEIANNYCRNNHIDIFHDDVIEFKTYITDYFSQTQ